MMLIGSNFDEEASEAFRKRLLGHLSARKELASFGIHVPIADGLTLGVDIVGIAPSSCSVSLSDRSAVISS